MSVTWIMWSGMVLLWAGGLSASFAWYGRILNIVEKDKAKMIWVVGMTLTVIGIILTPVPIGAFPSTTEAQKEAAEGWSPLLLLTIAVCLIGAIPFGIVAQSKVLDIVELETAQKAFKTSLVIMSIGALMMLWITLPSHMLP